MDGNATISRRQFIVTAATAAGGLAIGPSAFGGHGRSTALEQRGRLQAA
jgi:hypothetical protein